MSQRRRSDDRLHPRLLGPRELEALALVEERPGIAVAELREILGVGRARVWQIVSRLEMSRIRRGVV